MMISWRNAAPAAEQIADYARARRRLIEEFGEGSVPVRAYHALTFGAQRAPGGGDDEPVADPLDDDISDMAPGPAPVTIRTPHAATSAVSRRAVARLVHTAQIEALTGERPPATIAELRAGLGSSETLDEVVAAILRPVRLIADRLYRLRTAARRGARLAQDDYDRAQAAPCSSARNAVTRIDYARARLASARRRARETDEAYLAQRAVTDRCRERITPLVTATLAGEMTGWRHRDGRLIDASGRDLPILDVATERDLTHRAFAIMSLSR